VTKTTHSNLILGGLALLVVVLDQWTKALIRQAIPLNTSIMPVPWLEPYVHLTHIQNAGAAFGLGQGLGKVFVFTAFVAILLIVLYFRHLATGSGFLRFALGLQLGGAVGNLIDRLTLGGVTDFVDLGWFPIFNVADSAITVGTILLGIYALFLDRPENGDAVALDQTAEIARDADLTDSGAH
jgi:signal peptidase II